MGKDDYKGVFSLKAKPLGIRAAYRRCITPPLFQGRKKWREKRLFHSDAARLRRDELSYNAAKLNLAAESLRYHSFIEKNPVIFFELFSASQKSADFCEKGAIA